MTTQSDIERIKAELRAARVDADGVTVPAVFSVEDAHALLAHVERLEGVVAKLPITKDGVRVVPGEDSVYLCDVEGDVHAYVVASATAFRGFAHAKVCDCYSTEEAAGRAFDATPPAASSEEGGEA